MKGNLLRSGMKVGKKTLVVLVMMMTGLAGVDCRAEEASWVAAPRVVAHRGFWQAEGSAQNSLRALAKADSIGCYASEFDVWITRDGIPVVNHDRDINGIIIEESDFADVRDQLLPNGEVLPTLDSYLKAASELDIRLVCELKAHDSRSQEREALKKILSMVEKYGLTDRTDYITFSPYAFSEFIKLAPKGSEVYYLEGDYIPQQIKAAGGAGIDYSMDVIKKHPEWIDESHKLGLLVNIWTVNEEDDMQWCIDRNVDFITTNRLEELQRLLKANN